MWYFPLLRPYVDHVPVKADLSDLDEKIEVRIAFSLTTRYAHPLNLRPACVCVSAG
jgi:hypothetical protein